MIVFDTPRPARFRHFTTTAHMASTELGDAGTAELIAFGRRIGLRESWLQHRGEPKEHFDLFDSATDKARRFGAVEVTPRGFILEVVQPKRAAAMHGVRSRP